jgi:hypothetical protein
MNVIASKAWQSHSFLLAEFIIVKPFLFCFLDDCVHSLRNKRALNGNKGHLIERN